VNSKEALALLAVAAQYDPTILPVNEVDQASKAAVWAQALSDVPFAVACEAVGKHYAKSDSSITIAALNVHAEKVEGGVTTVTIPRALPECQECGLPYQRDFSTTLPKGARCVGCGVVLVLVEAPGVGVGGDFRAFTKCFDCGRSNQVGKHAFCVCGASVPSHAEHSKARFAVEEAERSHLDDPMALGAAMASWAEAARAEIPPPQKPSGVGETLTRADLVRLRAVARAHAEKRGQPFDAQAWRGPNGEKVPEAESV